MHLASVTEDPIFGSTMFNPGARNFPTTLHDTTVTCDHTIDADGDGCGSTSETALGLDPANPWDFFSVPVPALIHAIKPAMVLRDRMVAASDAQAIFAYFKANARAGMPIYTRRT